MPHEAGEAGRPDLPGAAGNWRVSELRANSPLLAPDGPDADGVIVAAPTTLAQVIQHARLSAKVGAVDISALTAIVEHTPEDMTVTVQAGLNWLDFQDALAAKGQWI